MCCLEQLERIRTVCSADQTRQHQSEGNITAQPSNKFMDRTSSYSPISICIDYHQEYLDESCKNLS